ncbi:PepSY domain-containing protein [Simiduia sp. 21SJ11W-1]|uniref:PepSY domain-containing protein n=1 Tax=Simiduia sp. 21SJ11W-1 TaxID=2909669 RepID=UPI0020A1C45E|nr:PepSY domain-containing protein [Simiduia sp. 21SJ11W-1]UTA49131.1 PepSY domain-containing protein [Simiduia sp. 21SJ11W-1]
MLRKTWRPILWRWHKRIGLGLILLLLWLSVTGIFLNHTDDLALAEQPLRHRLLLNLYGISEPEVASLAIGEGQWLSRAGDYLYWNSRKLARCPGSQISAVPLAQDLLLARCDQALLILANGEIAERIGASYGTPQPMGPLGHCGGAVCMQSGRANYLFDVDQLRWTRTEQAFTHTLEEQQPPAPLQAELGKRWLTADVNWQRLMLDLHAGRPFGLGPWLMDAVALLIIVLAMSGFGIWLAGRKRRR